MGTSDILRNTIIVAAHPDDEILWFSSLLRKVDHVLLCFLDEFSNPEFGAARRAALLDYPLQNMSCLELVSLGLMRPASFVSPTFNQYGIKLIGNDRSLKSHREKYNQNYSKLRNRLASILIRYRNVITHNPWGEYGHEEHVQVYRAVKNLQEEIGYDIWIPSYCSNRTMNLVSSTTYLKDNVVLPTDHSIAAQLMKLYEENGCWTWYKDWCLPAQEAFFKETCTNSSTPVLGAVIPMHVIVMQLPEASKSD